MIFYRNHLVLGIIRRIISTLFKAIYYILSVFNLQLTLLVLAVGAVLYLTGVLNVNPTFKLIYNVVLIISVIYAIVATLKKLLGFDKKHSKGRGVQIVKTQPQPQVVYVEKPVVNEVASPVRTETVNTNVASVETQNKPRYYRVKQNPEFVMAEYADKYELYRITAGGLVKIRTDYK